MSKAANTHKRSANEVWQKGTQKKRRKSTFQVWAVGAFSGLTLVIIAFIVFLIMVRGVTHFWPAPIMEFVYYDPELYEEVNILGSLREVSTISVAQLLSGGVLDREDLEEYYDFEGENRSRLAEELEGSHTDRWVVKVGNRDVLARDFYQVLPAFIVDSSIRRPKDVILIERLEWGDFLGYPVGFIAGGKRYESPQTVLQLTSEALSLSLQRREQIEDLETNEMQKINAALEKIRLEKRAEVLAGTLTDTADKKFERLAQQQHQKYEGFLAILNHLRASGEEDALLVRTSDGEEVAIGVNQIVRFYQPNKLSFTEKVGVFGQRIGEFLSASPREANTEGGVFPAIFGTAILVMIMSLFVAPLGMLAAVYMSEYSRQGQLARIVRISVNNLAGVPSIVFGVVGLGFFVYVLGASIDDLFFSARLPAPTFGSPGLLWSSLTLAMLTVPVVIVATEEGLRRVPSGQRLGALALGATRFEMLAKVVIPMAAPSALTGLILAVSRAAGEVAPLMLVGVVKYAPSLPVDSVFPYVHLDRTFMHLGFHIFDLGFQSPNVEAAEPVMYATAFLLLLVILVLNLAALSLRRRLIKNQIRVAI